MTGRAPTRQAQDVLQSPIVAGSIIILALVIAVVISYNANRGLPFTPTYDVTAEVPDAAELIEGGSEVRLGGARIGIVQEIQAVGGEGDEPPFARLRLTLNEGLDRLPVDTRVMVRPRSLLGAKFLQITPGESEQTLPPGATIPLEQATPLVEIDEAFNVFDPETSRGLQNTIVGLGDGLAGRGSAVNATIGSLARALPGAQRVLGLLADPSTDLDGLITGLADVTAELRPVAPTLADLAANGATTFGALDREGEALEQTLVELPPTEAVGTRTLTRVLPVLDDASGLARDLRPASEIIGGSSRRLAASLRDSTPVLRRIPSVSRPLITTLRTLDRVANRPSFRGSLNGLTATVQALEPALRTLVPAQTVCNVGPIFFRNVASALSQGDAAGGWLTFMAIDEPTQMTQQSRPSANLHTNPIPNQDATECEAGNEPFLPGQQIGNPPGAQSTRTDDTAPPPDARARAERAGLLAPASGAGR